MTRFPLALSLVAVLALPVAHALAQSATAFDDAQRATVREYFEKQAEKAAAAEKARKAKEAEKAKAAAKTPAKPAAKSKKVEKPKKPKKPAKPKAPKKGKAKAKAGNGKDGDGKKPPHPPAKLHPERGQVLAQDLPRRALPKELDALLGKTARGTRRVIVGDDIVLFERRTGRILDIMEDAVKSVAAGR